MNKTTKVILGLSLSYGAYKLAQLYSMSEKISYLPVGFKYKNGVIEIKMQITNPVDVSLNMRGLEGRIYTQGQTLGTYSAGPFTINKGYSYFTMYFKVDPTNVSTTLLTAIISGKVPVFTVDLIKKLPLISVSETFNINANNPTT